MTSLYTASKLMKKLGQPGRLELRKIRRSYYQAFTLYSKYASALKFGEKVASKVHGNRLSILSSKNAKELQKEYDKAQEDNKKKNPTPKNHHNRGGGRGGGRGRGGRGRGYYHNNYHNNTGNGNSDSTTQDQHNTQQDNTTSQPRGGGGGGRGGGGKSKVCLT